jgi:hypothetical protein
LDAEEKEFRHDCTYSCDNAYMLYKKTTLNPEPPINMFPLDEEEEEKIKKKLKEMALLAEKKQARQVAMEALAKEWGDAHMLASKNYSEKLSALMAEPL